MHVFMLGWEFPPAISGGLGTACHGLTRALAKQQTAITFVIPRDPALIGHQPSHLTLLSASNNSVHSADSIGSASPLADSTDPQVQIHPAPSTIVSPYQFAGLQRTDTGGANPVVTVSQSQPSNPSPYEGDLIAASQDYAERCVQIAGRPGMGRIDVIHAHDWLTFPAGLAISRVTGRPLVVHVHSTEFDRCGHEIQRQIFDIERRGMHGAIRVICVSHLTRSVISSRYGIGDDKIDVVYNGIDLDDSAPPPKPISKSDKIVLFLGRITMQKGPQYFLAAAQRVLEKIPDVTFVVAGSGDQVQSMMALARDYGIGDRVVFTGFLQGDDVKRVFELADVYVMPSVSEPFGIAPLEAISHDVPVIISRNSGVAEVLKHVLKVDFWDIDEMANKIVAVLRHPSLSTTMQQGADFEIRQLTWEQAADKCLEVYQRACRAADPLEDEPKPILGP